MKNFSNFHHSTSLTIHSPKTWWVTRAASHFAGPTNMLPFIRPKKSTVEPPYITRLHAGHASMLATLLFPLGWAVWNIQSIYCCHRSGFTLKWVHFARENLHLKFKCYDWGSNWIYSFTIFRIKICFCKRKCCKSVFLFLFSFWEVWLYPVLVTFVLGRWYHLQWAKLNWPSLEYTQFVELINFHSTNALVFISSVLFLLRCHSPSSTQLLCH